ncbi:MAG TPA: hypothetical protein VF442_14175 [Sphingobium sp.]
MIGSHELPVDLTSRPIVVSADPMRFGNFEAWINIIQSYRLRHPEHVVRIRYRGDPVNNLVELFKIARNPDTSAFEVEVDVTDGNYKDLVKLYRLLAEGASEGYHRYITKEMFQVLRLF